MLTTNDVEREVRAVFVLMDTPGAKYQFCDAVRGDKLCTRHTKHHGPHAALSQAVVRPDGFWGFDRLTTWKTGR